jgi:hypothetical protein
VRRNLRALTMTRAEKETVIAAMFDELDRAYDAGAISAADYLERVGKVARKLGLVRGEYAHVPVHGTD